MKYKYRKLRGRIKEMYGSQAKFAEAAGLSKVTVCRKLVGQSGFSQNDVEKWAGLLNIEKADYGEFFYS